MPKLETPEHRRILTTTLPKLAGVRYQVERDVLTWLVAGLESNKSGVRFLRVNSVADDLGRTAHGVRKAVSNLAEMGLLKFDPDSGHVWVPDCLMANPVMNPSHATHYRKELSRLGSGSLVTQALDLVQSQLDTVSNNVRNTVRNTVPDTVRDIRDQRSDNSKQLTEESKKGEPESPTAPAPSGLLADVPIVAKKAKAKPEPKAKTIVDEPPTLEQTRQLFEADGCCAWDADAIARGCHGYWESEGWLRKGKPLKSWPGTVRTWLANQIARDPALGQRVNAQRAKLKAEAQELLLRQPPAPREIPEWERLGYADEEEWQWNQRQGERDLRSRLVDAFGNCPPPEDDEQTEMPS